MSMGKTSMIYYIEKSLELVFVVFPEYENLSCSEDVSKHVVIHVIVT
jgi:hypothetical protein